MANQWIDEMVTHLTNEERQYWLSQTPKQKQNNYINYKFKAMTKTQKLNALYQKYNLTTDDYFKHKFYTIITRSGIDKIQAQAGIEIEYILEHYSADNKCVIIQAFAEMGDIKIQTFGEASPGNTSNSYPVAMAEKRAMSRAVLKLTGFYSLQVFGEDEADEFKKGGNK
tara:strand:+ start:167 stop:673 length:507 start_codon:yes stop_codon:yes gene_type:complete